MNSRVLAVAIGIVVVTTAAIETVEPEFSAERIRAHVNFLADDLLEGREAGTRGHEMAARYIASQFAQIGVKAGRPDGYFQTVGLVESALVGNPTFKLTTARANRMMKHRGDVMITGPMAGGSVEVSSPLVFVGYGMTDAGLGYDDYKGFDVRGKIAVVLWGSPKGIDSEVGAHLQNEQRRFAAEHGALALVYVPTRATSSAFPWQQVVQLLGEGRTTTWVRDNGTPFDPSYGLKASLIINPATAASVFEDAPKTLTQVLDEAEQTGGRPGGFALKTKATISVATKTRRFSSPEVIGVIEGADAKLKDEYVVLMGHADHIGTKNEGTGDRINNGALDNAAGVAIMLEVARAVTAGDRPRRSILVIANTAEEKGLLGAEYFAHSPGVSVERVIAGIDLDMPMLLYDFTDVVAYGATHSTLQGVFQKVGASMGVKLSPDPMPEQAVFVRSDHYALVKRGIPAVMLATGMANGGDKAWAKFLASNYHQPSDDVSQPILWSAGAKFAELNYRVLRALADTDVRPRWYAGDYFGNLFAARAQKAERPAVP